MNAGNELVFKFHSTVTGAIFPAPRALNVFFWVVTNLIETCADFARAYELLEHGIKKVTQTKKFLPNLLAFF